MTIKDYPTQARRNLQNLKKNGNGPQCIVLYREL